MNSYQTVNAAFAAAGLTKQAAVNYGRRFEAGLFDPFGQRTLFDILVELAKARAPRGAQIDVLQDSVYVDPVGVTLSEGVWPFPNAPRVDHDPVGRWNAEDKERQLKLKTMAEHKREYRAAWPPLQNIPRDQSEDRVLPRAIVVATQNPTGVKPGLYFAVHDRRNLRRVSVWFTSQDEADEAAEGWVQEYGNTAWEPVYIGSINMVWGVPHTQADGYSA